MEPLTSRNRQLALQLVADELTDSSNAAFHSPDEAIGAIMFELFRMAKCSSEERDAETLLEIFTQIAAKATRAAAELALPEIQRAGKELS